MTDTPQDTGAAPGEVPDDSSGGTSPDTSSEASSGSNKPGDPRKRGRQPGMKLAGLKTVRAVRDLTVKELAAISEVHPNTIVRLENQRGGADNRTAHRIARALDVPLETLRQDLDALSGTELDRISNVETPDHPELSSSQKLFVDPRLG